MKRQNLRKVSISQKLVLHRETVKWLTFEQLADVVGGSVTCAVSYVRGER